MAKYLGNSQASRRQMQHLFKKGIKKIKDHVDLSSILFYIYLRINFSSPIPLERFCCVFQGGVGDSGIDTAPPYYNKPIMHIGTLLYSIGSVYRMLRISEMKTYGIDEEKSEKNGLNERAFRFPNNKCEPPSLAGNVIQVTVTLWHALIAHSLFFFLTYICALFFLNFSCVCVCEKMGSEKMLKRPVPITVHMCCPAQSVQTK